MLRRGTTWSSRFARLAESATSLQRRIAVPLG